ncbi:hypothetical protein H1C71_009027, partial [Ictidomys tridecemlineatus]
TERELFCFAPGRVQTHNVKSRAFCVVHLKCFLIYITLIPSPLPPPHQSFQISLEICVKHAEGKKTFAQKVKELAKERQRPRGDQMSFQSSPHTPRIHVIFCLVLSAMLLLTFIFLLTLAMITPS